MPSERIEIECARAGSLPVLLRAMDASTASGSLGNAAWLIETAYRIADEAEAKRRVRAAFMEL